MTERKKKDVDLHSRPPLLRRPVTSSVGRRGVGKPRRPPFEISRCSTSPPIPDLGATPLQYVAPKLTTLYNIAEPVNKQRIGNQTWTSSPRSSTHCRPASATSFRASTPCHLHAQSNSRGRDFQESRFCGSELSHAHNWFSFYIWVSMFNQCYIKISKSRFWLLDDSDHSSLLTNE